MTAALRRPSARVVTLLLPLSALPRRPGRIGSGTHPVCGRVPGRPPRGLRSLGQSAWGRARKHDFRRTVATVLDRASGPDLAAELLGHTSSKITKEHYVQPDEAVDPVTAEILESLAPKRAEDPP
jgi:integrase